MNKCPTQTARSKSSSKAASSLAIVLALLLTSTCSKGGNEPSAEIDHEPTTTAMEEPSPPPTPPQPVDNEPLETKIDRVLGQATVTKGQYESFRDRMFDEAFSHVQTILCSTFRLQLLSGTKKNLHETDPEQYISTLRAIFRKQGNRSFVEFVEQGDDGAEFVPISEREVGISIPKSEAYSRRYLSVVKLTFRDEEVPHLASDGLTTEWETRRVLDEATWSFDPETKCEPSYLEPVVNSAVARRESSENMATLIASSLESLRTYPAKLETAEREWTRANDVELLLMNLKKGLAFNSVDLTARDNVRSYEKELAAAMGGLNRARAAGSIDPPVSPAEVKSILALFR